MRYLILLALAGCTSMPAENAWLALHAIDTVQTLHIARDPEHYREVMAAPLIGEHPSERSVIAYMGGSAIAHYLIADALHERAPRCYRVFEVATLAVTGRNVYWNWRIGL